MLGNVEGLGAIERNEIAEKMAVKVPRRELMNENVRGPWAKASSTPTPGTSTRRRVRAGQEHAAVPAATPTCRCPAARSAGSRCATLLLSQPDPAAPGRAHQHLERGERAVARPPGRRVRRRRSSRSPQTVLPRQRGRVDLEAGRAYQYEGNYSTYLETKQTRLKVEGREDEKRAKRLKDEFEWVRSNAKGRQAKSKARLDATRRWPPRPRRPASWTSRRSRSRPAHAWAASWSRSTGSRRASTTGRHRRPAAFSLPRIVGMMTPNGAGKTTLFKMIPRRRAARQWRDQDR